MNPLYSCPRNYRPLQTESACGDAWGHSGVGIVMSGIWSEKTRDFGHSTTEIFKSQWQPDANVNVNTQSTVLENNVHEVELTVTVTMKNLEKTIIWITLRKRNI